MINSIHFPMSTSRKAWMCIAIFAFCSVLMMGCLFTQPGQSPALVPSARETRPDSTQTDPLLAALNAPDSVPPDSASPDSTSPDSTFPDSTLAQLTNQVIAGDSTQLSRKDLLEGQFEKWSGTPHRWGGNDDSGIDCSALVQRVYADVFGTSIPRTTKEQVRVGSRIPVSKLDVGDLVFYRINSRTRHVGIYVGENAFFHVSKSEGVAITSLDAPYWKSRFWMARRIIPSELDEGNTNSKSKRVEITW